MNRARMGRKSGFEVHENAHATWLFSRETGIGWSRVAIRLDEIKGIALGPS